MHIIGYTYEASVHCDACACDRFGDKLDDIEAVDKEGNPLHPIFCDNDLCMENCDDCGERLIEIYDFLFNK